MDKRQTDELDDLDTSVCDEGDELYSDEDTGTQLLENWARHSAADQKRALDSFGMTSDDMSKMVVRIS